MNLFNTLVSLYENLIVKLIEKESISPLVIYTHIVFNNLKKVLVNGGGSILSLEILINLLSQTFNSDMLKYFIKNYDWNFIENSIIQDTLHILY